MANLAELNKQSLDSLPTFKAGEQILPMSPAKQIVEAAIETAVSPTPGTILADVELAISLVKQLIPLTEQHPNIATLVKWLF